MVRQPLAPGVLLVWLATACASPEARPTPLAAVATVPPPAPAASAAPSASPASAPSAVVSPSPAPTLAPTRSPSATPAGQSSPAAALPTVETTATARGPGFLTPIELELELEQPLSDSSALRQLVESLQQLDGIASVRSDGVRILVRYDSTRVLPARIRARLAELGAPARGGTDVQNPGDAAD